MARQGGGLRGQVRGFGQGVQIMVELRPEEAKAQLSTARRLQASMRQARFAMATLMRHSHLLFKKLCEQMHVAAPAEVSHMKSYQ